LPREEVDSGNWLLVLDNVSCDTLSFLREHLPRKNSRGNILFTTRMESVATALAHAAGVIEIHILKVKDAPKLLLRHFGEGEINAHPAKVEELVTSVGCLPLAIAPAYTKQTGTVLDSMLALLCKNQIDVGIEA
jgi:hypothetical protein